GLLIMFAVFSRFNPAYEEAARDLGAGPWQTLSNVVLPILLPGITAVALFGFTLSYDEFPRTLIPIGSRNTLPLELWAMTTNLTKRFDQTVAVNAIDLAIPHRSYCCLLGPSGCGKTTILRMIAGHETPTEGDVRIGGESVVGFPPARRGTAMMFQNYALFPH